MKLGDFPLVESLVDVRNNLLGQRDEGRISVEIDGKRLAPDLVEAVKPAIQHVLSNRIAHVDDQLRQLGVEIAGDQS